MYDRICHIVLLFAAVTCLSCSRSGVGMSFREAQGVVAQADSLWHEGKMYGVDDGDSAALAQAYETFGKYSVFSIQFSDTYAHACYHYGKLLRAKDDPVSAMQAFIAATHSRTRDYHILGRVYSNMGDICHLASEFPLAYDMFEQAAEMFLRDRDTLSYYYDLDRMAFEKASLADLEACRVITKEICQNQSSNNQLISLAYTAYAEAYLLQNQYDSTLYYAHKALFLQNSLFIAKLQIAQAYSFLKINDSATYYAKNVVECTDDLWAINNALYILTNNDEAKNIDEVRQTSADRSDTQKLLEIRQGKLSQAVQLLEQDLARTPDKRWLYAIIATIVIIATGLLIYIRRKHRQHQLLSQQIDDLKHETEYIQEKHEQIVQEHKDYTDTLIAQIEQNCIIFSQTEDFPNNICWKDFRATSKIINDNFGMIVLKLQNIYHLQEKEIRLCILVLLGKYNGKRLAKLLFYAESGVRNFKSRVANKLGTNSAELHNFLINLAISEYSKCTP